MYRVTYRIVIPGRTMERRIYGRLRMVPLQFKLTLRYLEAPREAAERRGRKLLKGLYPNSKIFVGRTTRDLQGEKEMSR
jgi:hypothetical protein